MIVAAIIGIQAYKTQRKGLVRNLATLCVYLTTFNQFHSIQLCNGVFYFCWMEINWLIKLNLVSNFLKLNLILSGTKIKMFWDKHALAT